MSILFGRWGYGGRLRGLVCWGEFLLHVLTDMATTYRPLARGLGELRGTTDTADTAPTGQGNNIHAF